MQVLTKLIWLLQTRTVLIIRHQSRSKPKMTLPSRPRQHNGLCGVKRPLMTLRLRRHGQLGLPHLCKSEGE
jgi:hypothetical protein